MPTDLDRRMISVTGRTLIAALELERKLVELLTRLAILLPDLNRDDGRPLAVLRPDHDLEF